MVKDIIDTLNKENGTNYKLEVLEYYKDVNVFKRVLQLAYDKVKYTYGITNKNIDFSKIQNKPNITLNEALDVLVDEFCTRKVTGNNSIIRLNYLYSNLSDRDLLVLKSVIDRDLRINVHTKSINKVFGKNFITKVPYLRCSLLTEKTANKIQYPCYSQLKCDGAYSAITVNNSNVEFTTRSGESNFYPLLAKAFKDAPNGVYIGELLVHSEPDRKKANGLINSLTPPDDIYVVLWDFIELNDYSNGKSDIPYTNRFETLMINIKGLNKDYIQLVPTKIVNTYEDAYSHFKEKLKEGLEGTIIKDYNALWKDGTSLQQIKMKMEMSIDVRCIGFIEGKGRLKGTLGSIEFSTDDKRLIGSCSGFSDEQRLEIWNNTDKYLNKVFEVKCNEVTQARNKDTYALSYPNFVEFRDKDCTDDIQRVLEIRESVLGLS